MIEVKVSFDTDSQRALNDTRHWAALSLSAEEKHSVQDPAEMERLAAALPIERIAKRWIVSSDPDEHVAAIRTYIDYGFDHLVFHAPGNDQSRFIDLYAREILPRLRRLTFRRHDDTRLRVWAVPGIPEVGAGDDLALLIGDAIAGAGRRRPPAARDGDILVVASKIVAKAEGRLVPATDREKAIADDTVRDRRRARHAAWRHDPDRRDATRA